MLNTLVSATIAYDPPPEERGLQGAGTVHHVAWGSTPEEHTEWRQRAMAGGARIAESDLLGLALIGGSPGALVARQLLQHKTSKQPFSNQLHVIFGAQIGVLISLTFF